MFVETAGFKAGSSSGDPPRTAVGPAVSERNCDNSSSSRDSDTLIWDLRDCTSAFSLLFSAWVTLFGSMPTVAPSTRTVTSKLCPAKLTRATRTILPSLVSFYRPLKTTRTISSAFGSRKTIRYPSCLNFLPLMKRCTLRSVKNSLARWEVTQTLN